MNSHCCHIFYTYSRKMAPIVANFHPCVDTHIAICETHVTDFQRTDALLHRRMEPGDTSSDQKMSTAGVIGVIAAVLIALGILAWLCHSLWLVEQRKAKERIDNKRKSNNAQLHNGQPKGQAIVKTNNQENVKTNRQENAEPRRQENGKPHRQEDAKPALPNQQPKQGILKKPKKPKKVVFDLPPSTTTVRPNTESPRVDQRNS